MRKDPPNMRSSGRKAFTLIELLVVIAIMAILMAILLPSLKNARDKAKEIICISNLRQQDSAVFSYVDDWNGIFPNLFWPPGLPWMDELKSRLANNTMVFQCPTYKADWTSTGTWPTTYPCYYGFNQKLGPSTDYGCGPRRYVSAMNIRKPSSLFILTDTKNATSFHNTYALSIRHHMGMNVAWADCHVERFNDFTLPAWAGFAPVVSIKYIDPAQQ